jgi:hypothetical protein
VTSFGFNCTFTVAYAQVGKVTFKAHKTIISVTPHDPLPGKKDVLDHADAWNPSGTPYNNCIAFRTTKVKLARRKTVFLLIVFPPSSDYSGRRIAYNA